MKFKSVLLCLIVGLRVAATSPIGPSLYLLRATDAQGSSLVFIDEHGRGTIVARDERKAVNSGTFTKVGFASHFGPFAVSADGTRVLYSLVGPPKYPVNPPDSSVSRPPGSMAPGATAGNIGASIAASLIFSALTPKFPMRELEAFFEWNRNTGVTTKVWDRDALKLAIKNWEKSHNSYPFKDKINFVKSMDHLLPLWIEPLKNGQFALVLPEGIVALDSGNKTVNPFHVVDILEKNPEGMASASKETSQPFRVWKDSRGEVNWIYMGEWGVLMPDGSVDSRRVPLGWNFQRMGDRVLIGDGLNAWTVSRRTASREPFSVHSKVKPGDRLPIPGQTGFIELNTQNRIVFLRKLDAAGKVIWDEPTGFFQLESLAISASHVVCWKGVSRDTNTDVMELGAGRSIRRALVNSKLEFQEFLDRFADPLPTQTKIQHDVLDFDGVDLNLLSYEHNLIDEDRLSKVDVAGNLMWSIGLGKCKNFIFIYRQGANLWAIVRRSGDGLPHRLQIDPARGKVVEDRPWPEAEAVNGGFALGPDLLVGAAILPGKSNTLVWIPSSGPLQGPPDGAPVIDLQAGGQIPSSFTLKGPARPYGGWYALKEGLVLHPLALVALGDRPMPIPGDGACLVSSWENYGFMLTAGEFVGPRGFPASPVLSSWVDGWFTGPDSSIHGK